MIRNQWYIVMDSRQVQERPVGVISVRDAGSLAGKEFSNTLIYTFTEPPKNVVVK